MKAVILLAGKGRRMGELDIKHKSLTMLDEHSMLYHLIRNMERAGIREIYPIVGYNGDYVLSEIENAKSKETVIIPVWNREYETTNNLYSIYQTRKILEGEDFLSINGDMIFDYRILSEIQKGERSQIAVDDRKHEEPIDSPGITVKDGKITDLGRHIPFEEKYGYAVGIYRYGKEMSDAFFAEAEQMLQENINAGFHDPLVRLFSRYAIPPCSTKSYLWTDIDEESDIEKARGILKQLKEEIYER